MWYEKYRPSGSLKTYFGHRQNVRIVVNWMNSVLKDNPISEGLLFHGPPGTGKTSLVQVLSDVYGVRFIHSNASDSRKKDDVKEILSKGSSTGLFSKKSFVVLDEAESVPTNGLRKVIENTHCIIITNFKYEMGRSIRDELIELEFDYPDETEKNKYAKYILKEEEKSLSRDELSKVVKNSLTFRSVAKNLQLYCMTGTTDFIQERTDFDMFEEVNRLFGGEDVGRADMEPRTLLKWALDNEGNPALISKLDKLLGKTPPNDYRSWRYVYDLVKYIGASTDVEYPRFFKLLSKYKSEKDE